MNIRSGIALVVLTAVIILILWWLLDALVRGWVG